MRWTPVAMAAVQGVPVPPGGFATYSWDTLSTFCFPGGTGPDGWGGNWEQAFNTSEIELYLKYDLIMIAMLNQAKDSRGAFVPQGMAMSVARAAAIKKVSPSAIVFAYIAGYLAQPTFEGGAKLAAKGPSWWLHDSLGVPLDNNYSDARLTNCHCHGYAQDAPGPMSDF